MDESSTLPGSQRPGRRLLDRLAGSLFGGPPAALLGAWKRLCGGPAPGRSGLGSALARSPSGECPTLQGRALRALPRLARFAILHRRATTSGELRCRRQ